MKALVYHGPGKKSWEETAKPVIKEPTDAVEKVMNLTNGKGVDTAIEAVGVPATFEHAAKEKALKVILTK
jgi:alcohol dehydrogenase